MKLRLVVLASVFAFATPAFAQEGEDERPLAARFTEGRAVKKRGRLSAMRGHRVTIGGRKTLTAGELADDLFREQAAS